MIPSSYQEGCHPSYKVECRSPLSLHRYLGPLPSWAQWCLPRHDILQEPRSITQKRTRPRVPTSPNFKSRFRLLSMKCGAFPETGHRRKAQQLNLWISMRSKHPKRPQRLSRSRCHEYISISLCREHPIHKPIPRYRSTKMHLLNPSLSFDDHSLGFQVHRQVYLRTNSWLLRHQTLQEPVLSIPS